MTRSHRSTPSPAAPARPELTQPRSEVARQLEERIEHGKNIQTAFWKPQNPNPLFPPSFAAYNKDVIKWREYNFDLLKAVFTTDNIASQYSSPAHGMLGGNIEGNRKLLELFRENVDDEIATLESVLERLNLYPEPSMQTESGPASRRALGLGLATKIFVVHGHDEGALQATARFLEAIGLDAIILREKPDQGLTIIEKFEACAAEVGFAVALLTPDDLGGAAADEEHKARARQNVIFELGYFVGALGRGRACLLRKGQVEIPSDLAGVIYTDFDHPGEGWKVKLARELTAARIKFDASKVLA
jgi:predicted nucleotide-binding protein